MIAHVIVIALSYHADYRPLLTAETAELLLAAIDARYQIKRLCYYDIVPAHIYYPGKQNRALKTIWRRQSGQKPGQLDRR